QWVADTIEPLWHGQVQAIVRHLRRGATWQGMSPKQREPIAPCATSWAHHALSLHYPPSLAQGYPIATGVIEGACRYLVKDRLEITGARWGLEGGEAVRKLRALYIHGACNAYWACHASQEYQRHHQAKCSEIPMARPPLKRIARQQC